MKLLNGTRLPLFLILLMSFVQLVPLKLSTPATVYADGDDSSGLTLDLADTHEGIIGIYGRNNGDKTGIGLDTGDVNGDGFDDIVIGARCYDAGALSDAGIVYVIFGSPVMFEGGAVDLVNPRSRILEIVGASGGDNLGESVSVGDFDGDGYGDIVLGAPEAAYGGTPCGAAYILFGSPSLGTYRKIDLRAPPAGTVFIQGEYEGGILGHITTAGDLNGDGYDDAVICGKYGSPLGRGKAGVGYIVFGGPDIRSRGVIDLASNPDGVIEIQGREHGDELGIWAATGDVNGDSFRDLVIGAWYSTWSSNGRAGRTYVVFGSADIGLAGTIDMHNPPPGVLTIVGAAKDDYSGTFVGAGDTDGDGIDDVLIGAHGYDFAGRTNPGVIYAVPGSNILHVKREYSLGTPLGDHYRIVGHSPNDHLSRAIVRDFNGDGIPDVAVTATDGSPLGRGSAGIVYVVFSTGFPNNKVVDLANSPDTTMRIFGNSSSGYLGFNLAAGDVDGDGCIDLIMGAHDAQPPGRNATGIVYLVSGASVLRIGSGGAGRFVPIANTGNNALVLIPSDAPPTVYGTTISKGGEIGVFTPRGVCAGAGMWTGGNLSITIWGDDSFKDGIEGFLAGEPFTFKYRDSSGKVTLLEASWRQGEGIYTTDGISIVSSLSTVMEEFTLRLSTGWNMVSLPIIPQERMMADLFVSCGQSVLVKSGGGKVFWPMYAIDFIGEWRIEEGYQVHAAEACDVAVTGYSVFLPDVIYRLSPGWNMISYISEDGAAPSSVFGSLVSRGVVVKNGFGEVYWPEYGIDGIDAMRRGEGYWLRLDSPSMFRSPAADVTVAKQSVRQSIAAHYHPVHGTGENAILLFHDGIIMDADGFGLTIGDEIGVLTPDGVCAGAGVWNGGHLAVTVWGDDPLTDAVEGFIEDEPFRIAVFDRETGIEHSAVVAESERTLAYSANGVTIARSLKPDIAASVEGRADEPSRFRLEQNMPNPFNPVTTIPFAIPEAGHTRLTIYNLLGEEVAVLVDGFIDAGNNAAEWNAGACSSGMYFYRLESGGRMETRKMLYVK